MTRSSKHHERGDQGDLGALRFLGTWAAVIDPPRQNQARPHFLGGPESAAILARNSMPLYLYNISM